MPSSKEEPAPAVEQKTPDSLPLKPSRREKQNSPEPSPEASQRSTEGNAPTGLPTTETVDSTSLQDANADIEASSRERDALDDIIDESKATSHLVRIPFYRMKSR